ncbi:MAG TPA: hypothetical protein VH138_03755, partial [Vicinamibacterales bacterium]|nr:hypothetical protein [Vicinamibacterales bacterium]
MVAQGPRGVFVLASTLLALTFTLVAQQQPPRQAPGAPGAPGTAQAPPPGGGRGAPMWEADFSKKGTVPVLSPADEAKKIWMQPGFKLESV